MLGYDAFMSLRTIITLLRRHDLFAGVDAARLEVIAFTAERETFEAGDVLFEEGEEAFDAYLFLKGQAVMFAGKEAAPERQEIVDVGDPDNPWHPTADRLVLSEGHAVPIVYAAWAELGGRVGHSPDDSRTLTVADLDTLRARDKKTMRTCRHM